MKKVLSIVLSVIMIAATLCAVPFSASASSTGFDANTLSWSNGEHSNLIGAGGQKFTAAVRFNAEDLTNYEGRVIDRVSFDHHTDDSLSEFNVEVITIDRLSGFSTTVSYQTVKEEVPNGWYVVELNNPVTIDLTKDIQINIEFVTYTGHPIAVSNTSNYEVNGSLFHYGDKWSNVRESIPECPDSLWNIKGLLYSDAQPTQKHYYAIGNCFSCGYTPDTLDAELNDNGDGTYSKTFTATEAIEKVRLKVVEGDTEHMGDEHGKSLVFTITEPGEFKVTYNPSTGIISVEGSNLANYVFSVDSVCVAGSGKNNFLNNISWRTNAEENMMTAVSENVWEITFDNVGADSYDFKFAINGSWDTNFGTENPNAVSSGTVYEAISNSSKNISFKVDEDNSSVTIRLDLSGYQSATESGAKFTLTVTPPPHVHTIIHVSTVFPTCTEPGREEHYYCEGCGKKFFDIEGKIEISDFDNWSTIYPTGHDFGDNEKYCSICGAANPNYKEEAQNSPLPQPVPQPITPVVKTSAPAKKSVEQIITSTNSDKKDVSGSEFRKLMLKATAKKQTITLSWKKVSGASGYIIYGAQCGKKLKKIATVSNPKTVKKTIKKLKKGTYYQYVVVAYKKSGSEKKILTTSKSVHCVTDGGKKGNPNKLTVNKSKLTLKKGKTAKIKATMKGNKTVATHNAKFRYESSNTKIATVDKSGKIKAKKKGSATIYVYTQNGMYKTVKVTVK